MRAFATKFVDGAVARGAPREVAERVYAQIVGFSGFGFPKAHSAAFGLLAYQSTWLRVHYGPEFLCALLNEQPMGFYPPDSLVHEAQRRGMEVLAPDVVRSRVECTVERLDGRWQMADGRGEGSGAGSGSGLAVRLGLGYVNGVAEADIRAIVADRDQVGPFRSAADLAARCAPRQGALELLAWAGACDSLCPGGRREALWQLGVAAPGVRVKGGTQLALPVEGHATPVLRKLTPWERMLADYGSTKVTLREHPLELMRPLLGDRYETSDRLSTGRAGRRVLVAGLVVARQRPATAHGVTFMLLEDELGAINLIVPPPVYESSRGVVRAEPLVWATGRLERRDGVTNIVVDDVGRLERPDLPLGEVRHIEPKVRWSNERAAAAKSIDDISTDDLRAVAPAGHSFGRRG
jgi:error-prone DNA polymerase